MLWRPRVQAYPAISAVFMRGPGMTGPDGSEQFVKRHDFVSPRARVIAGLLAAAFGLAGCGQPTPQAAAPPPAPVTVAQPVKRTVHHSDAFHGPLQALTELTRSH